MSSVLASRTICKIPVFCCGSNGWVQHASVYPEGIQGHRCQGKFNWTISQKLGWSILPWKKPLPNNHSQKEKKSPIMDDFRGKESVTLPLSGKCSHKPWVGFPSNVPPGRPALGYFLGDCLCWEAFMEWLAALKFTFSAHSHWRVFDFFITPGCKYVVVCTALEVIWACRLIWYHFQTAEQMAFLGSFWQALHILICFLAWFIPPCANVSVHENCELTTLAG